MSGIHGITPSGLVFGSSYDVRRSPAVMAWATGTAAPASAVWPSAQLLIAVPYLLEDRILVKRLWMANGTVVANGNVDVGLYARDLTRIVASGAVATAGASDLQYFDVTDTWVGPGLIYIAGVMTSASDTAVRLSTAATYLRRTGVIQMASQTSCPATITAATMAQAYLPMMGFTTRDTP